MKVQLALDTLTQASNLFVSATEIYKVLSPLGPVGVGLATATIVAMIAGFAASKIKALDEINKTKLEKGATGVVKGRRHYEGGERFSDHIEVEEGERWSVFNRAATGKHSGLIRDFTDLINKKPYIDRNGVLKNLFPSYNNLAISNAKSGISKVNVDFKSDKLNEAASNLNETSKRFMSKPIIEHHENVTIIRRGKSIEIRKK